MNDAESNNFYIGPTAAFDEGGIATRSRFGCVIKYNKDKLDKICINFFVLADSTHYFVRHIDVYQGNNMGESIYMQDMLTYQQQLKQFLM